MWVMISYTELDEERGQVSSIHRSNPLLSAAYLVSENDRWHKKGWPLWNRPDNQDSIQ